MALQRRRGRKIYDLNPSWSEVMTGLGPDIWYEFSDASGNLVNSGSEGSAYDLSLSLPTAYAHVGPTTDTAAAASIPLNGIQADSPNTAAGTGLQDLNTGAPAATGTIVFLFRVEAHTLDSNNRTILYSCSNGSFDDDAIELRIQGGSLRLTMKNGSVAANIYEVEFNETTQEAVSTHVLDGNWHMVAVVQDATSPKVYYDGGNLMTADSTADGASIDATFWADDLPVTGNDQIKFGGSPTTTGGNSQVTFQGHADEWAYFDGVELSAGNLNSLWGSISSNVDSAARGARESILYALREMEGGTLPSHAMIPFHPNDNSGAMIDQGSASTNWGDFDDNATGITFEALGPEGDSRGVEFNPGGHVSGDILQGSATSADMWSDTTGWVAFLFKVDNVQTWNMRILEFGNTSAGFDSGECQLSLITQGVNAGRFQFEFRHTGAGGSKVWFLQMQNGGAGDADPLDGNYHLVIAYQPNDTTGVIWYLDDVQYLVADALNVEGTGTEYDSDVWFADADVDLTGTRVVSVGSDDLAGTEFAGLDGGVLALAVGDSAMNTTKSARLFAATGLSAP